VTQRTCRSEAFNFNFSHFKIKTKKQSKLSNVIHKNAQWQRKLRDWTRATVSIKLVHCSS
jgi:hypothetical protein